MTRIILFMVLVISTGIIFAQNSDSANFKCGKSTVEYAGQTYQTVKIGNQCWLKRSLNVGTMISVSKEQSTKVGKIEKYCYGDDSANCATYGGLYQWNEAMQYNSESAQGICPKGWHIPGLEEFQTLSAAIKNDGNPLKAVGQGVGDGYGSNTTDFSALLAGFRHYDGYSDGLHSYFSMWGSTEGEPDTAYLLRLSTTGTKIYLFDNNKANGLSVRCLKD